MLYGDSDFHASKREVIFDCRLINVIKFFAIAIRFSCHNILASYVFSIMAIIWSVGEGLVGGIELEVLGGEWTFCPCARSNTTPRDGCEVRCQISVLKSSP